MTAKRPSPNKNFIGRAGEIAQLNAHLDWVRGGGHDRPGRALLLRGRRRVGKSRLVEVFAEASGAPFVFFTAAKGTEPGASVAEMLRLVTEESTLSGRPQLEGLTAENWATALRLIAQAIPDDEPTIIVLDEVPWLVTDDPSFEGTLQAVWDRYLSRKPILLILIGSDLSMMEALSSHGRPFYQRGAEMILSPLNLAEVADMCGVDDATAFDAYLITGGLPLVCQEWRRGQRPVAYLEAAFTDPTSPLIVSGERILSAELPASVKAREALDAIGGHGERTFSNIAETAAMNHTTLTTSLQTLEAKRLVAVDEPLSTKPSTRDRRFRIDDPYLRFWLAFVPRALPLVERGRPDLAIAHWNRTWNAWRGRAIEPVIRSCLGRLLPDSQFDDAVEIGGWWPRTNVPELDLVAGDRRPVRRVAFAGSIKWRDKDRFGGGDFATLARDAVAVPGVDASTPLVAVSRSGIDPKVSGLATAWGPSELVAAWR